MTHQFNGRLTDKGINHRLPNHTQVTLLSLWFMTPTDVDDECRKTETPKCIYFSQAGNL